MFASKLISCRPCRPTRSSPKHSTSFSVGLLQTVCSFACDFIAPEIMESVLTFNDDKFCKFLPCAQLPYSTHARCTGDACALETRRQFVTERGKERKAKFKPRPHCLGNNQFIVFTCTPNQIQLFKNLLRTTKGARNPNLDVAFTNACAAAV